MDQMETLYERVGGLEVHKKSVVACRRRLTPFERVEKEVATFGTTTRRCGTFWKATSSWCW
jgi:hypothetical protein